MPIRRPWLACLVFGLLACGDSVTPSRDPAPAAAAERPAGWQSLDDEASAQRLYYQFVDERRQVRFVESLDDVPAALRAGVGFVKMAVAPPLSPGDARRARNAALAKSGVTVASVDDGGPRVVLYSAEWCGACTKAKNYLRRRGTQYEERNVDIPAVAEELFRKTGERGIPVLEVDGRVLSGFSEGLYDDLLDRA